MKLRVQGELSVRERRQEEGRDTRARARAKVESDRTEDEPTRGREG